MWLPETAVNDDVLAVLAEEDVGFTILAPSQALRWRPLGHGDDAWQPADDATIDTRRLYRWCHHDGSGRGVTIVFYDGPLSHDAAFGLGTLSSGVLVERAEAQLEGAGHAGLVCLATDGETFGHHHKWGDRTIAYALAVEAPRRGLTIGVLADLITEHPAQHEVAIPRKRLVMHARRGAVA